LTLASLRRKMLLEDDVSTPDEIRAEVVERFSRIAQMPEQEQKFPVGPDSAKALGYDADMIDQLPRPVTESFTGVGNPLALGTFRPGQIVLDVGCGAGLDSILAARAVAPTGNVIGADMTKAVSKTYHCRTRAWTWRFPMA
jgi:arsenite methyltransferase